MYPSRRTVTEYVFDSDEHEDSALPHFGQRGEINMFVRLVNYMLIDLVGDDEL